MLKEIILNNQKYHYGFVNYIDAKRYAIEEEGRVCFLVQTIKDGKEVFCEWRWITPLSDLDISVLNMEGYNILQVPTDMTLEQIKDKVLRHIMGKNGTAKDVVDAFSKLETLLSEREPYETYWLNLDTMKFTPIKSEKGAHIWWKEKGITHLYIGVTNALDDTEAYADSVLKGDILPCIKGRMPEDFMQIEKIREDKAFGYERDKCMEEGNDKQLGGFVIYDKMGRMGCAYRVQPMGGRFRWAKVFHPTITEKSAETDIVAWQMPSQKSRYWGEYFILTDSPYIRIPSELGKTT